MAVVINGSTGITFPAGGTGNPAGTVVGTSDSQTLTNKTLTTPNIDSAQFATVSGTAPLYSARAWVNFNGTGTVAIRASGNVTSITDNGTGDYTVNFTTALVDADFSAVISAGNAAGTPNIDREEIIAYTTSTCRFVFTMSGVSAVDPTYTNFAAFR